MGCRVPSGPACRSSGDLGAQGAWSAPPCRCAGPVARAGTPRGRGAPAPVRRTVEWNGTRGRERGDVPSADHTPSGAAPWTAWSACGIVGHDATCRSRSAAASSVTSLTKASMPDGRLPGTDLSGGAADGEELQMKSQLLAANGGRLMPGGDVRGHGGLGQLASATWTSPESSAVRSMRSSATRSGWS